MFNIKKTYIQNQPFGFGFYIYNKVVAELN